jgi:eukaryotic-like serine/threonine-protein kinase
MPTDRDLFQSAIDLADDGARAEYLNANAPDPVQRARVERLLAAHAAAGEFLEQSPADENLTRTGSFESATGTFTGSDPSATVTFPGHEEHIGAVLAGKYKLIEAIGEGGMGSVYMALQTLPVKRTVAVKVIKAGMDSRAVLARFEAERQALAMMDHPTSPRFWTPALPRAVGRFSSWNWSRGCRSHSTATSEN